MAEPVTPPTRLLVIDDDGDLRLFLRDLLTEEGYEVDLSATLDEALALLETRVYHLIITDLLAHSPSDPLRTALTLRDFAHPTPVAALTGWNVSAEEVAREGLVRLIPKPFDLDELLDAVAASVEMIIHPRAAAPGRASGPTLRRVRYARSRCDGRPLRRWRSCVSLLR